MTTQLQWTPQLDGSETAEALGFKYQIRAWRQFQNRWSLNIIFVGGWVERDDVFTGFENDDSSVVKSLCQSHHDAILKAVVSDPVREHMEAVLVIIKGGGFPLGTIDQLIEKVLAAYAKHKEGM